MADGLTHRGRGNGEDQGLHAPLRDGTSGTSEALNNSQGSDSVAFSRKAPDKPCHKTCESLFSSSSGFFNYRGLLNDCILLLVLSNSHNVISNLYKYGILVDPSQWASAIFNQDTMPTWSLLLLGYAFPTLMLVGERLASKGSLTNKQVIVWYVTDLTVLLALPVAIIFFLRLGPFSSLVVLTWYTVLWLKLVSYCQVNWWCRMASSDTAPETEKDHKLVVYPNNLTVSDLLYFCWAPTLCYELNFPRIPRIRKIFLIRRILEAVFLLNVVLAIFQQWLMPTAINSLQPFKDMDYSKMLERLLLLAIPNHVFWLLFFYFFFHSMMNLVGELLRFADREFYGDWWNSVSIQQFWKMWNIPVHRWAMRHVYLPLRARGWHRGLATLVVFFLSAFFHEYLVSIPLLMLRPWAFTAMLFQIPLGILTALPFFKGQLGNVIVWTSIVLGQPVAILMYMHDYYWTTQRMTS
jgi:diacylglycerol O-acyltransferase-1